MLVKGATGGYISDFELTKHTQQLTLMVELLNVLCEYFQEKWLCYNKV